MQETIQDIRANCVLKKKQTTTLLSECFFLLFQLEYSVCFVAVFGNAILW